MRKTLGDYMSYFYEVKMDNLDITDTIKDYEWRPELFILLVWISDNNVKPFTNEFDKKLEETEDKKLVDCVLKGLEIYVKEVGKKEWILP